MLPAARQHGVSAGKLGRRPGPLGRVQRLEAGVAKGWGVVGEPEDLGEPDVDPARLQSLLA